ncbi:MAG: membrane protein [Lysobacteraceae bacterium]|nr:MAG: membrane protein [Xanthomonadaceae bacterium]
MNRSFHFQRYLLTGLLTVFPLWLTFIVFQFVLTQLSRLGAPLVDAIARGLERLLPAATLALNLQWLRFLLAVVLTVGSLYLLGWLANRVVGKRLLGLIDGVIERIPLVQSIYGGTKKLLAVLQTRPEGAQRVVLIEFPHPGMRSVGLVTRVLREEPGGRELAAVYVPTTPNPTSGYLEVVPVEQLVPTDWTVDQAMAFIISGGAVAPDRVPYSRRTGARPPS